jgi:hypothetical protein
MDVELHPLPFRRSEDADGDNHDSLDGCTDEFTDEETTVNGDESLMMIRVTTRMMQVLWMAVQTKIRMKTHIQITTQMAMWMIIRAIILAFSPSRVPSYVVD